MQNGSNHKYIVNVLHDRDESMIKMWYAALYIAQIFIAQKFVHVQITQ